MTETFFRGTTGMDIPPERLKRNVGNAMWLLRNARIRNANHPGVNCLINQCKNELRNAAKRVRR